jgi:hypothetical protein
MFSKRSNWKLAPNLIAQRLDQLKKSNVEILDLTESNPTRCKFAYLEANILAPFLNPGNITYEPSAKGLLSARQTIQSDYSKKEISLDTNNIFLTASTSEAYSVLFRLLLNPGERVLAPRPSYPLFDFLASLNDVTLDHYRLFYDGEWSIDMESVEKALRAETKAIILVHPNNPTGSFLKRNELSRLAQISKEKSIALISDEVFADFAFNTDSERVATVLENSEAAVFSLGGISKSLGLPQMKLAWIAAGGPTEFLHHARERLEVILDTYLSVNTPVQNALAHWFSKKAQIQANIQARISGNRAFLSKIISASSPCNLLNSEGGWYGILKLPKVLSEEEWVLKFLEENHVFVHPAYFFDFEEEAHIVMSLLPEPVIFQEGIKRILSGI